MKATDNSVWTQYCFNFRMLELAYHKMTVKHLQFSEL